MSEEQLLKNYQRYLRLKSITDTYRHLLYAKELLRFLESRNLSYEKLDVKTADEYKGHLLTERGELSRGTINNMLCKARVFCRYLYKKRLVYENPFEGVSRIRKEYILPKNILSVKEMGKLLDNFALHKDEDWMMKAIVELLYGSGLRIGEVKGLKEEDIEYETGALYMTDYKSGGKRYKRPASEVSLRYLKAYLKYSRGKLLSKEEREGGYLFPQGCQTRLRGIVNHKLKRECRRLQLPVISSHSFRHSCATHLLRSGAGIRQVQAFLGHQKITSTERYTRVVKEDLKRVIKACHPRERRGE